MISSIYSAVKKVYEINTEKPWNPKLYLVSRSDLPPGVQACQAIHAFREFIKEYSELEKDWYDNSNHIAFLSAYNKKHLLELISVANKENIKYSVFYEPDLNHDLTAVVFEPTMKSREMLKNLPLALLT